MEEVVPNDSRYIPFTQQPSCCVPTCIQTVMYKVGIPLLPAEQIGYELGLIVSSERKHLFYSPRTSETPPPAGYGTRIYEKEFEPNAAFKRLGLPLKMEVHLIERFGEVAELLTFLREIEEQDGNALVCFNHGTLVKDPKKDWGHVCIFDRVVSGDKVRIIDPSPSSPKWKEVRVGALYKAMKEHGEKRAGGVWELVHTE